MALPTHYLEMLKSFIALFILSLVVAFGCASTKNTQRAVSSECGKPDILCPEGTTAKCNKATENCKCLCVKGDGKPFDPVGVPKYDPAAQSKEPD